MIYHARKRGYRDSWLALDQPLLRAQNKPDIRS